MKPIVFTLLVFTGTTIFAQPVIGPDDMPSAGQSFQVIQSVGIDVDDPAATFGDNVLWDYSDLMELNMQNNAFVAVSETPVFYQFFFNNPFIPSYANHARPVEQGDFELPIPITDIYNFYRADEDGYFDCGFAASLSGFPLSGARNPTDRILKFPLEYGMAADTNDTFFNLNIPELANIKSYRTRFNSLDGWGTVITPGGSYEALRVRSVVNGVDSVYSETFEIDQALIQPETIEYRWVSSGAGLPVLQINTVEGEVTQVTYRGLEVTSVVQTEAFESVHLFPNPASQQVTLEIPGNERVDAVMLIDLSGRRNFPDFTQNVQIVQVDINTLSVGMYRVVAQSVNHRYSAVLIISR